MADLSPTAICAGALAGLRQRLRAAVGGARPLEGLGGVRLGRGGRHSTQAAFWAVMCCNVRVWMMV